MNNLTIPLPPSLGDEVKDIIKKFVREGLEELKDEMQMKELLSQKEAMAFLGVSYSSLKKMEAMGLKSFRIDRKLIYSRTDLLEFLEANKEIAISDETES